MADLILGMPVDAIDAPIGPLTAVVFDPTTDEVTHIVVEPDGVPGSERLVPVAAITRQDTRMALDVRRHEFFDLPMFETSMFVPDATTDAVSRPDVPRRWALPFVHAPHPRITFATHEQIPKSEVALRRGTLVVDADGQQVGRARAFVVDRSARHVTHVVIDRSHLLRHREVTAPIAVVKSIDEHAIILSIDSDAIDDLPHIAVA